MSAWKTLLRKKNPELGPLTHSQLIIFPRQDAPLLSAQSAKCFRMFVIAAFLTAPRETPRLLHQPTTPSPAPLLPDLFVKFSSSLPFFFFFFLLSLSRYQGVIITSRILILWPRAVMRAAERLEARGHRDWAAEISHKTPCAPVRLSLSHSFLDTSRRYKKKLFGFVLFFLALLKPAPIFLGIAMSTRKTSLTDKQTKNGTSKYVLERCASINEYYDIAFKVCISVLSCVCVCVVFVSTF